MKLEEKIKIFGSVVCCLCGKDVLNHPIYCCVIEPWTYVCKSCWVRVCGSYDITTTNLKKLWQAKDQRRQ